MSLNFTTSSSTLPPTTSSSNNLPSTLITLIYLTILYIYTTRKFNFYRKNHKQIITLHIITGLTELQQYYFPCSMNFSKRIGRNDDDVVPLFAVVLCLIQCVTNVLLTRRLSRGNPGLVRPVYLTGAIFRTIFIIAAYTQQSASLYHDSIIIIHAFAYTRLICYLFTVNTQFSDSETSENDIKSSNSSDLIVKSPLNVAQTYTVAVYGAALVAMGQLSCEFNGRYGSFLFLAVVGGVMRLEGVVSGKMIGELNRLVKFGVKDEENMGVERKLVWGLYKVGVCGLQVLMKVDQEVEKIKMRKRSEVSL